MEYRLEMIHFDGNEEHTVHLINCLNRFAGEGWRVVSVDLSPHPSFSSGPLPVLLERSRPERI